MAYPFFRLMKFTFGFCCVVGFLGFTLKTNADDFDFFKCNSCDYNTTALFVQCNCTSNSSNIDNDDDDAEIRCTNLPCQEWSEWTNCTSTCGGGSRRRSRQCPIFDENICRRKSNDDISVCHTEPCPTWSVWSSWSSCTATCDDDGRSGYRTRTRACPKKDSCGNDSAFDTDPTPCFSEVKCPVWSEWEPWGRCSRSCGRGDRTRRRRCNFSDSDDSCFGSGRQAESCSDGPCPFKSDWSPWSPCTATCAGGLKTRSRLSCAQGPPTCPLQSEQEKCSEEPCPQWSDWTPWMECSKTCGGGQRIRKRTCPIDRGCVGRTMNLDRLRCNNFECPTTVAPPTKPTSLAE